MGELLPCPWCGDGNPYQSTWDDDRGTRHYFIGCAGCVACGPMRHKLETAIEDWNNGPTRLCPERLSIRAEFLEGEAKALFDKARELRSYGRTISATADQDPTEPHRYVPEVL